MYEEFKEQLTRSAEGWYETGLPWKGNHPTIPNNKAGSLKRLENTVRKGLLEQYDAIIKEQLVEGIIEPAEEQFVGREFYIPHKPAIRDSVEDILRGFIRQKRIECNGVKLTFVDSIQHHGTHITRSSLPTALLPMLDSSMYIKLPALSKGLLIKLMCYLRNEIPGYNEFNLD